MWDRNKRTRTPSGTAVQTPSGQWVEFYKDVINTGNTFATGGAKGDEDGTWDKAVNNKTVSNTDFSTLCHVFS